jgi:regulator of protease activity HflC (stomatin/prohibitin superfamily)
MNKESFLTPRKIKWFVILGVSLLVAIVVGANSCTLVQPGHVGVRVERAGANRGVQDLPIVAGWVVYNPITEAIIEFPTTVQTAVWSASAHEGRPHDESITFSSREGVSVSADVALSYHVDPAHAGRLFTRFRTTNLEELTHGYVRNLVRDALNEQASQLVVQDIYGAGKTQMLNNTMAQVRVRMGNDGFVIDQLSFQGALRLPQNVIDSINRALQATQDAITAQNHVAQVEAEARQRVAQAEGEANAVRTTALGASAALHTQATADADALLIRTHADAQQRELMATAQAHANEIVAASLTPAVIEFRRLERWNGILPTVSAGGATPFISVAAGR